MRSRILRASRVLVVAAATLGVVMIPAPARAQLISPGELASAHSELEGIRNCTQCHELRQRGASDDRCLACHTPLKVRIERGRGLHATYADESCTDCHKEHAGAAAHLVRFDTLALDHEIVGFELHGAHAETDCRTCHAPELIQDREVRRIKSAAGALERTFLGLGTTCLACHKSDDPHDNQFEDRACDSCHGEEVWDDAPGFDHADTRFPLTGEHRTVACESCHAESAGTGGSTRVAYRPLAFSNCTSCHVDSHEGALGQDCTTCHSTAGWDRFPTSEFESRFDHALTGFALEGAHAAAECAACHSPRSDPEIALRHASDRASYPAPVVDRECLSCHVDYHDGEFLESEAGANCTACHEQEVWVPTTFDLFRHRTTDFPLEGAHRAAPCTSCHTSETDDRLVFAVLAETCATCHAEDDPHAGQFEERGCEACHSLDRFDVVDVDHDATRFPLEGAHVQATCTACHPTEPTADGGAFVRYRPLETECRACHTDEVGRP